MTMNIDIKEQYLDAFDKFINSLPKDAIKVKTSLNEEINKRIEEYRSGKMETLPHDEIWNRIEKKLN